MLTDGRKEVFELEGVQLSQCMNVCTELILSTF